MNVSSVAPLYLPVPDLLQCAGEDRTESDVGLRERDFYTKDLENSILTELVPIELASATVVQVILSLARAGMTGLPSSPCVAC